MVQFANPLPRLKLESGGDEIESAASSGHTTPDGIGSAKRKSDDGEAGKKKRRRRATKTNGESHSRRRHSVSKPARDPRDNPSPQRPVPEVSGTRSPSPVIDFDGLSRPSTSIHLLRL